MLPQGRKKMNPIFMQNMAGVQSFNEEQKAVKEKLKSVGLKVNQESITSRIVRLLFECPNLLGNDIKYCLELKKSPSSYIQKQVKAGRIIMASFNKKQVRYRIKEGLTLADFKLEERKQND